MDLTLKLAGVLVPLVFAVAVLNFVHEALMPLILPLLLIAAVVCAWWLFGRPRNPPGANGDHHRG